MNLFLVHLFLLVCPHRSISFVFRIVLLLSHGSLVRLKQKLTVAHVVSVMQRQCFSNCTVAGKFVLTKRQKQSRVFPLAAASTHTHSTWTWIVLSLCFLFVFEFVWASVQRKRASVIILKYTESQKLQFTFFYKNNSSPWENICTNNNNYYMTDLDMGNEIFSCFWFVRPFY